MAILKFILSPVLRAYRRFLRRNKRRLKRAWSYIKRFTISSFSFIRGGLDGLAEAPPATKRIVTNRIGKSRGLQWEWAFPTSSEVFAQCQKVFNSSGLWPISFSYPETAKPRLEPPTQLFSPMFPGHRYQFTDVNEYIRSYAEFAFAMTHQKGGWDCFRHLEIMHAGTIPFMPDAHLIPPGTMVHYPKAFFVETVSRLYQSGDIPPLELFDDLANYFNQHLTTARMAKYVMAAVGVEPNQSVLFLDPRARDLPDYASILTGTGFKQILRERMSFAPVIDYLYSDWQGSSMELYGRGFGYTKVLDPATMTDHDFQGYPTAEFWKRHGNPDWVVVGSFTRNPGLVQEISPYHPPERTILIHGEDRSLTAFEAAELLDKGFHLLAREISADLYF